MPDVENVQRDAPNVLVTGVTSLKLSAMETDNLGNFIIIQPLYESLRKQFPDSRIQTTLQLSEEFAARYDLEVLRDEAHWQYNLGNTLKEVFNLLMVATWRLFKNIGLDVGFLARGGARVQALKDNDLIIDFSGDLYGENALNWYQFLMGSLSVINSRLLGTRMYSIASSPGPFNSLMKVALAKFTLKRYQFVSVREPFSLNILNGIGLRGETYFCYPCFSFGYRPIDPLPDDEISKQEPNLGKADKPIVGLILCNLNMKGLPLNKWPRDDDEYEPFLELIEHLVTRKNVRVCVFSHRNKTDEKGKVVKGSDHLIVDRLLEMVPASIASDVFSLNGFYDAPTMNRIISRFEALVSGRIHGAVQGISQYKPTLIVDYGSEPKAHKLRGFALLCGLYDFVCDPNDAEHMKQKFDELWARREAISLQLQERVPILVEGSRKVWKEMGSDE